MKEGVSNSDFYNKKREGVMTVTVAHEAPGNYMVRGKELVKGREVKIWVYKVIRVSR